MHSFRRGSTHAQTHLLFITDDVTWELAEGGNPVGGTTLYHGFGTLVPHNNRDF